jgi:hypothetical protein
VIVFFIDIVRKNSDLRVNKYWLIYRQEIDIWNADWRKARSKRQKACCPNRRKIGASVLNGTEY